MDLLFVFLHTLWHYVVTILPPLLLGFLISGVIHEFIPTTWVERYLGKRGILPILWATIIGTILPVCCWGSLPIALSFYKKGSRLGPVLAFLVATPATSVSALFVAYRFMGIGFTVYIFFSVIVMGLVIGLLGNLFSFSPGKDSEAICSHCAHDEDHCACQKGIADRLRSIMKFAFIEMPREIGVELLAGLVLAAAVSSIVPLGALVSGYLSGVLAYPFSIVVGLMMYFCSTASVPLVHALVFQGMNIGAAFVLLLVGPITSYGTILVLRKEFGWAILIYYIASICLLATGLGFALSLFY